MRDTCKVVLTTLIGDILLWYDYALYGELIGVIGEYYFPVADKFTSLIWVFLVFAMGFVMRPLGALCFGFIGDKYGRKKALLAAISCASFAVLLIAALPSYSRIGIYSTILLIIARMSQGLSIGGESGNAVSLIENTQSKYPCFIGSFQVLSAALGVFFSSLVIKLCIFFMDNEFFYTQGWRITFVIGVVLGFIGIWVRNLFSDRYVMEKSLKNPLASLLSKYKLNTLVAVCIDAVEEATLYVFLIFFDTLTAISIGNYRIALTLLLSIMTMSFAFLSDKLDPKNIMLASCVALLLFSYPIYTNIAQGSLFQVILYQALFVTILAASLGPVNYLMCSLFPPEVRFSGFALSRNLSAAIFGGFAPLISTSLIQIREQSADASIYMILCSLIGIVSLLRVTKIKKYTQGIHINQK